MGVEECHSLAQPGLSPIVGIVSFNGTSFVDLFGLLRGFIKFNYTFRAFIVN